jgi:acetoin utilization protein AcuB
MHIEEIMTRNLVVVKMDDSLAHVKNLFELKGFHHLVVVEDNKIIGVISDRDLFKAISPNIGSPSETHKDIATLNKRAHQIMSRDPITIEAEKGMFHAIQLFNRNKISCLPVVNKQGKPVGMLSWRDILRSIEKHQLERKFSH